jgi:hypothetical protein
MSPYSPRCAAGKTVFADRARRTSARPCAAAPPLDTLLHDGSTTTRFDPGHTDAHGVRHPAHGRTAHRHPAGPRAFPPRDDRGRYPGLSHHRTRHPRQWPGWRRDGRRPHERDGQRAFRGTRGGCPRAERATRGPGRRPDRPLAAHGKRLCDARFGRRARGALGALVRQPPRLFAAHGGPREQVPVSHRRGDRAPRPAR